MVGKSKLKIAQFISGLGKGGAERLVVDLSNALSENANLEVFICTFNDYGPELSFKEEISPRVKYINFGKKSKFDLGFQFRLLKFLIHEKPMIVNSHLSGTVLFLYPPILFLRNIHFFHTVHNLAEEELTGNFMRSVRKLIYKTNKLNTISISNTTELSHFKLYNIQSDVIYNGVKRKSGSSSFESVKKEIEQLKKDRNCKVFLSIGRINSRDDQKNFSLLVDVFAKLYEDGLPAALVIIGADTSPDQSTLNELTRRKTENVHFVGPKSNVSDYLLNSDFFCLSSKFEGLPVTIIEALSYGLPVISTDVGGINELIIDNENGLLVKSLEMIDYYHKTLELIQWNDLKIADTRSKNQKRFRDYFSIEKTAANYLKTYTKHLN
jgi:glycosyltransferase involved in cell wall biosynthesis